MSVNRMIVRAVSVGALILAGTALPGCLVSSHSNESFSGTYVSEPTFSRIEPGVTTKQWVLGTLGEPTKKTTLENGEELWKWQYCKTRQSSGAVLFLFGGSSTSSQAGSAYVQFKDDVATKAWRAE